MLNFKDPDSTPDSSLEAITRLLRIAILAMVYEYLDHADFVLRQPAVATHLAEVYDGLDVEAVLGVISRTLLTDHRRRQRH